MKKQTFEKFKQLVYQKSGITLGPQKVALVTSRVSKRMRALNITDHDAYLRFVIEDKTSGELVHLLDSISTNVTSFYREPAHYDFLAHLIQKWDVAKQAKFRIWCAASSSGEEPYCLAMTTLEALGGPHQDFRILATDISTKVLDAAQKGEYAASKLEPVPAAMRQKYFTASGSGANATYTAKEALKRIVSFNRLNLSVTPFPMKGPLDVVFCRNVMIYFDNAVRTRLLHEIVRLLKPGGYLMIGHSDSLVGIKTPLKTIQPAVFQKI